MERTGGHQNTFGVAYLFPGAIKSVRKKRFAYITITVDRKVSQFYAIESTNIGLSILISFSSFYASRNLVPFNTNFFNGINIISVGDNVKRSNTFPMVIDTIFGEGNIAIFAKIDYQKTQHCKTAYTCVCLYDPRPRDFFSTLKYFRDNTAIYTIFDKSIENYLS